MTTENITQLPLAISLDGTEPIEIVQNGTSKQSTTGAVAGLANLYPVTTPGYVLGNNTASPAQAAFHSLSSTMDIPLGSVQGSIAVRGAANWGSLTPGLVGQILRTGGPGADPFWATVSGTGTVYEIDIGANLASTQNPLVTTGTLSTVMNPVFTTSTTTPIVYGGTTASSTLTLQSTSGAGTSDSISFKTGNAGAVTALTFNTLGQGTFGAATTASSAKGAISYGTLGYSDTNVLESLQTSVNSYAQLVLQNTSNGATASADITISNDIGTASTNYANFGINSSGFTGTGSLSQPNNVYITSASSDLVLGTLGSNYIRFVVNSGATDAMTISPTGVVSIPNAEIVQTSLQTPLVTGGNTASSTLTLQSTSGAGTTDAIYLKTGNNGAVTALTLSTTGAASFANSVSATTVAATTSVTTPTIYGGSATSQALTFQSTTGVGATDSIVFKVGNNGATTALTIGTGTAGSLTFGGTAQRFLADFSNATALSRFAFQTSTTNGSTGVYFLPNGSSTAASVQATNAADPTNASKILIATNGSTDVQLVSGINGTGTYLPLSIFNGGLGRFVFGTAGQFGIGPVASVSYGTSGQVLVSGGPSAAPSWSSTPSFGATVITATSANAFAVGQNGVTNPAFNVDTSTATSATGFNIKSAAAGAGVALSVLSSGTNENLTLDAKGSGTITLGSVSTGAISLSRATTIATSTTTPVVYGGTTASSTLTLGSTSGAGTTYSIIFQTASQATRLTISTAGNVLVASGIYENSNTITSYTIPNGSNAVSSGPISITGTFVISTGSSWTCV